MVGIGSVFASVICKALHAEYRVDAATCERQVIELLERMRKEGLIEVRG